MALGPRPRRPAPPGPLRRRLRAALSAVGPHGRVPRAARGRSAAAGRAGRAPPGDGRGADRRGPGRLRRLGVHAALAFERDNAAPAVARRWARVLAWHPSLPFFWPDRARRPRQAGRVDGQGGRGPGRQRHGRARRCAPSSSPSRTRPRTCPGDPQGRGRAGPGAARPALERGASRASAPGDEPEKPLAAVRRFLREFPDIAPPRRGARPDQDLRGPGGLPPGLDRAACRRRPRPLRGPARRRLPRPDRPRPAVPRRAPRRATGGPRSSAGSTPTPGSSTTRTSTRPASSRSSTRPTSRPGSSGIRTT